MRMILDIETVPLSQPGALCAARLTNAATDKRVKEENRKPDPDKLRLVASVNWWACQVVAFGYSEENGPQHVSTLEVHDCERSLLTFAASQIRGAQELVTYNGSGFDLPVLRNRMAVHRIAVPAILLDLKRYDNRHLDLMMYLAGGDLEKTIKLSEAAEAMGVTLPIGNGSEIAGAFERGDWELICLHCGSDVQAVAEIAAALGLWELPEADSFPIGLQLMEDLAEPVQGVRCE